MVVHFAGKVAFGGVRAVREGGEGRALGSDRTSVGAREDERWDSKGRGMQPTDCEQRKERGNMG